MFSCHFLILILAILLPTVLLQHPPVITLAPMESFPKYRDLELSCQADGDPIPKISWHNAETNKEITSKISAGEQWYSVEIIGKYQQSRLLIKDRDVGSDFVVYCTASNLLGQASSPEVTIARAYINSVFIVDPKLLEGPYPENTVAISCTPPKGRPSPSVTWLRNGVSIDMANNARYVATKDVVSKSSMLKISSFNSDDEGLYQCLAENLYGSKKSSNISLSFGSFAKTVKVAISTTANITCSFPEISSVDWLRQDGKKMDLSRISNVKDNLIISNVKVSDAGVYLCQALLKTGNTRVLLVNVTVQPPATFILAPEDKTVLEGDDVVFKCIVSEYSSAKVYWELAGLGALFPNSSTYARFKVNQDDSLRISNVQVSDSGKYTCNYHSSLDAIHTSAHLTVKKRELANYPVISLPPQNQTLLKGSTATFRCEVVSHMEAILTWYRGPNNEPLLAGGRISLPTRGALQIQKIDPERDTNIYTCEAALKNERMKTRWTAFLRVIDADSGIPVMTPLNDESQLPLSPVLDSPYNKTSNSVALSWSSSGRVKYWIEYARFGSSDGWIIYKKDWPDVKITIQNLKPNSWYQFLVRARNLKGLSRASVPTEYIKTLSHETNSFTSKYNRKDRKMMSLFLQIKIKIISIHPVGHGTVEMKCEIRIPESLPLSDIEGFKVRYKVIPLSRCFEDVNLALIEKEKYCSLQGRSDNDIRAWILQNDMVSWFPSSEVHGIVTMGSVDIHPPITEQGAVIKRTVTGLNPFSCYEMSVDAYADPSMTSPESTSQIALTIEEMPSQSVHNIRTFWSKLPNVITVQWQMPPKYSWNGILTGFVIHIFANDSKTPFRIVKFNRTSLEAKVQDLDQTQRYSLHITLSNCYGEGVRSQNVQVPPKLVGSSAYEQQPWFIPVIVVCTLVFWVLLCCLVVYLCCIRFHLISNGPKFKSKDRELNLQPLIACPTNDSRFGKSLLKHDYDMNKNVSEALYSEPSMINQNHMTPCSGTPSACTFYASTSIVAPVDNSFANFYSSSLIDDMGPVPPTILPQYLSYAPHYPAYSHTPGMLPFSNTSNNIHNIMNSSSVNTNLNTPLYNVKDENHPSSSVQHSKYINQAVAGNNWPASVKMGLGQIGSSTSSSGSAAQKKYVDSKVTSLCPTNCATVSPATFGSVSSSPSVIASEGTENDGQDHGDESPKSTILYDVIPNGETGDEFCDYYSQSSDNHAYDSGNDRAMSFINGADVPRSQVDETDESQHSPDYSTDSITYSALPHRPYPKSDRKKQMRNKYPGNMAHKSKL